MDYVKRIYNKWLPEEDAMLREGIIPPRHNSYANCLLRARKLGFKFVQKRKEFRHSSKRDGMITNGVIPPETGIKYAMERAGEMGVDFINKFYEETPVEDVKGLSASDKVLIIAEKNQSTRKYKVKDTAAMRLAAERGRKFFLMHARSDMSIREIASIAGCTKQNVHRLIDAFKIYYFNTHCYDDVVKESDEVQQA